MRAIVVGFQQQDGDLVPGLECGLQLRLSAESAREAKDLIGKDVAIAEAVLDPGADLFELRLLRLERQADKVEMTLEVPITELGAGGLARVMAMLSGHPRVWIGRRG